MKPSSSSKSEVSPIGAVFTPLEWARFAIERFGIFEKWMSGKTVFDPTMGEGNLIEALIDHGLEQGFSLEELPVENLFGVEMQAGFVEKFIERLECKYSIKLDRGNFRTADIFFLEKEARFDILFGNPPWQNFVDLPENYKPLLKRFFFQYGLIGNAQDLLLGGSRIDIAALVIQKTIEKNLNPGGEAVFFMPLSLLLNDGAHKHFRSYSVNETDFKIEKIIDLKGTGAFENIGTRHGIVHFRRDKKQVFPIEFDKMVGGNWETLHARPAFQPNDPLSISEKSEVAPLAGFLQIKIKKESMPRQGVNSGGANDVFFFDQFKPIGEGLCMVSNKETEAILPEKFVYPLITSKNFRGQNVPPNKWVLLPYHQNGRPLEPGEVRQVPLLMEYLMKHESALLNRKGTLIGTWLSRGNWWAMLGVGGYNFFPFKIVWEAYGKNTFNPQIFEGRWQANQSLQAYIPVSSRQEAESILAQLADKKIEHYLLSLKMEGTMNWAQPGKIKKLLAVNEEAAPTLFG